MKPFAVLFLVVFAFSGCGKLIDTYNNPDELVDFHGKIIRSYDTVIVFPYSDNGGSYIPSQRERMDSVDIDNDQKMDFVFFVRHNQHTGLSPHSWYVDFSSYIESVNPVYSVALSTTVPKSINNFRISDMVHDGFPFSEKGYIYNISNDGMFEDTKAIKNLGDISIGIRREIAYHRYHYGYIQLKYVGYIILNKVEMGNHWSGCPVVAD
jgi:hypothetical protein